MTYLYFLEQKKISLNADCVDVICHLIILFIVMVLKMKLTNLAISCVVFFFSITSAAIAETGTSKTETPELPVTTSGEKGLEIEKQIPAYLAIEKVADKVQKEISRNLESDISLIFYDYKDNSNDMLRFVINAELAYKSYKNTINKLKQDYDELGIEKPIGGISSTDSPNVTKSKEIVSIIFEYLKLLKTNIEYKGEKIEDIKARAFIAKLSNKLIENNNRISIYSLDKYPLISGDATKEIIEELSQLQEYRKQVKEEISLEEKKGLSQDNKKTKKLREFESNVEKFFDELEIFKNEPQENSLQQILEYATFNKLKEKEKVYFMSIEILKAGSTIKKTTNLFSSRVRFSGGVIVNYVIHDYEQAKIVFSNLHNEYTGFKKIPTSK